jgi:hypothetical protein
MRAESNYPFFLGLFSTYESEFFVSLAARLALVQVPHARAVAFRAHHGFQGPRGYCATRVGAGILPLKGVNECNRDVTPRHPPGICSRVAVTLSHYSCAMNPPRCAI